MIAPLTFKWMHAIGPWSSAEFRVLTQNVVLSATGQGTSAWRDLWIPPKSRNFVTGLVCWVGRRRRLLKLPACVRMHAARSLSLAASTSLADFRPPEGVVRARTWCFYPRPPAISGTYYTVHTTKWNSFKTVAKPFWKLLCSTQNKTSMKRFSCFSRS